MRRKRKNFSPTFILTIFFWLIWLAVLLFFTPESLLVIAGFFLALFLALFFTFSLLLANSRRGFLIALGLILFLILRWQKMGHVLNSILLITTILVLETYFTKRK